MSFVLLEFQGGEIRQGGEILSRGADAPQMKPCKSWFISVSINCVHELKNLHFIDFSCQAKRPPPVIPYQRHLEGKKRLAESLKQQSASDMSTGILFTITPPDTPK